MGDLSTSETLSTGGLISLDDFQNGARETLPKDLYEYVASGSGDEQTLWENRQGFHRLLLSPRVLRDVSKIDTTLTLPFGGIGGKRGADNLLAPPQSQSVGEGAATPPPPPPSSSSSSMPVLIAPAGVHCLMHPEGELATARAAVKAGVIMGVSQHATRSLEDVAQAARHTHHHHRHSTPPPPLWYQLYILKDRALTATLIRRAEAARYEAICLTADSCRFGVREADWRNGFNCLPAGMSLANYPTKAHYDDREHEAWDQNSEALLDGGVTWEGAITFIRSITTTMPIIVKGLLRADDAVRAAQLGCQGIVVSNHGGRQLDSCISPIEALPVIADALRAAGYVIHQDVVTGAAARRGGGGGPAVVTLLLDSGVRRGTDVIKALALGASAVMIGKPVFFGLALFGEAGVSRVLSLLHAEVEAAMALCGCASLADITRDLVVAKAGGHAFVRPSRL